MQPTQALQKAFRKLPLTTKDIKKGFYKGTRTGSMGQHTRFGGYIIDWKKVRTYVVPADMESFKLTPFVANRVPKARGRYEGYAKGPKSPELYLDRWKAENGLD
ncbi:mitochondrial ribosomal protein L27-domain-containing protein [Hypoxylon fragiforme]|uniref:mitochondrial ribosomal protein L27-domain-containing protein n=1 Tax=Hypoxylon fragiforme TaxID=63214 RepID=UPI0020C5C789|nr:mitochondrial ribosomal protein L27-domain-containing protein [Hypoxylon fragiforme]KAI2609611.1 mitochondrial ribosomal protein L27-domain-containing protein [Hypoxylon fragiforme]